MIRLSDEQADWQKHFSQFDPVTMTALIELGRHWVQIKTLERNDVVVYWGILSDPEFEFKMRWVGEFLYDLHKNIWQ